MKPLNLNKSKSASTSHLQDKPEVSTKATPAPETEVDDDSEEEAVTRRKKKKLMMFNLLSDDENSRAGGSDAQKKTKGKSTPKTTIEVLDSDEDSDFLDEIGSSSESESSSEESRSRVNAKKPDSPTQSDLDFIASDSEPRFLYISNIDFH